MRKLLQVLLLLISLAQASVTSFAAQVWNYQFTPNGSRPVLISGKVETPDNLGIRADIQGTFSIVIDWDSNTGKIGHIDDSLVNTATVVSSSQGATQVPHNPSQNPSGVFARRIPYNDLGTVTSSNGLGHLVSNTPSFDGPLYEVWFTPTAATFSFPPIVFDASYSVGEAFAAFTSSAIAGDFNQDGRADASDYIHWRNSGGSKADSSTWRFSFGSGASSAGAVPEPSTILIATAALGFVSLRRRPL